jgi:hypothetical protein
MEDSNKEHLDYLEDQLIDIAGNCKALILEQKGFIGSNLYWLLSDGPNLLRAYKVANFYANE